MTAPDVANGEEPLTLRRRWPWAMAVGAVLTVAACGGETIAVASMATIVNTDKLPSDYIAEFATGLDCNTVRMQKDGGAFCRDPNWGQVFERPVYCYRTLGDITCYEKPNPYGVTTRAVR